MATVTLVNKTSKVNFNLIIEFKDKTGINTFRVTHDVNINTDLSPSFRFDGPVWVTTDYETMAKRIVHVYCHTKVSKSTHQSIVDGLKAVIPERIQVA